MALLAFAGFLRFDELSRLKLKDVVSHATYFELFIERSKTDQYREGVVVPVGKTGTDFSPWANLLKYLSQAKLSLPTSANGGDGFFFGRIQTKFGSRSNRSASKLSYTRCREVILKKLEDVGLDPKCYSWHSFGSGGASSAANFGISDRMFKRHSRWRSENAKDGTSGLLREPFSCFYLFTPLVLSRSLYSQQLTVRAAHPFLCTSHQYK